MHDLPAADAVYHQSCSINFRTGKVVPQMFVCDEDVQKKLKLGRPNTSTNAGCPVSDVKAEVFLMVTQFLQDNDDEQTTVSDLVNKMAEYLTGSDTEPYSAKYMKATLVEHFVTK